MILLIGSIFLNGCDDSVIWIWDSEETRNAKELKRKQKKELLDKEEEEFKEEIARWKTEWNKDKIALLSLKYSIPEETIQKLLQDYIKKQNEGPLLELEEKIPSNYYKAEIEKLSTKYNIPKEKLASMIIDFKLLTRIIE